VTFDRVRENSVPHAGEPFEDIVNHRHRANNRAFADHVGDVMLTLVVLLLFGGSALQSFVLALLIGMAIGTSSRSLTPACSW
jgi:preprotein translocase subunit SecF